MALRKPPQHAADAPIVYIHRTDSAWDHDRIAREREKLKAEDPHARHPVDEYWGGFTRYDLRLVADYLDDTEKPCRFYLKRLPFVEYQNLQAAKESAEARLARPRGAYLKALALALTKVDNGPTIDTSKPELDAIDLEELAKLNYYDPAKKRTVDIVFDLGEAAYTASMPLALAEKKASGSGPGPTT